MTHLTRRQFLQGCCAGIMAMNGVRLGGLAFAQSPADRDVVISLFLRGGMDSLSFLVPHADSNYHTARQVLAMDAGQVIDVDGLFGLHAAAAPLKELMDQGHLAVVRACGLTDSTRSHFEAQDFMELGTPGDQSFSQGGWMARYLGLAPSSAIFNAVTLGSSVDVSLEGLYGALALDGVSGFSLSGDWDQKDDLRRMLRKMYAADPQLAAVGRATLDAIDTVDRNEPGNYTPGNGVTYPNNSLGRTMASVAQLIRMDLGLRAATVNYGGWDTHESQADSSNPATGYFAGQVSTLSDALHAFWSDLSDHHGRLTVVVMSEFGRRLKENNNRGTDHGHAGVMIVMSAGLQQAGIVGPWPGLSSEELFQGVDLQVATDYRSVLTEMLLSRGGIGYGQIASVFPDYVYSGGLGIFPVSAGVSPEVLQGFMSHA
jgi:uncharacterized protein (DUF1501 family)